MMSKQSQYLLASVVESSQDSIVTIDLNRIITSWNKGAENLYGYPAEEVVGGPLSVVMLPEDIQDLINKVNDIIHELTVPIYETVRIHKNGRQADLEILLSPVRDASGTLIGVSTVARDITLRKMQEKQKDDFISIASHELKTPVTSIKAYTEIILEQLEQSGDEVCALMMRKLDLQVERLIGLIRTLLDTTKLTGGEMLLNLEFFDLNALIHEQIETFMLVSDEHYFTFNEGDIKPLPADRKLIGQVLTNIISNASKYSPKGGEIIITSKETGTGVEVSIQDFGIGIPNEVKDKIFDRYFRVSDPMVAAASGIGLGLYITAGIVRQHGGAMWVQSKEGKGATFYFTLPYQDTV
jgi:PAS domain S-box-containing protein